MPPKLLDTRKSLINLADAVNGELVARETEVDTIILCLIARMHLLLLSTPGTAKTYTFERLLSRVADAIRFDIMLQRDTKTDELFGPLDVAGLEAGHWRRLPDGYLPTCTHAVLDEAFKGNSGCLNGMLWATNERIWRDDGGRHPIPLRMAGLASNELPGDNHEELAAFYDRIPVRIQVQPLADRADLLALLDLDDPDPAPPAEVTLAQLDEAYEEARVLPISQPAKDALLDIRADVVKAGVAVTDRRLRSLLKMARAQAWRDNSPDVGVEHLEPLSHCLWDRPEQFVTVERIVTKVSSPHKAEVLALIDQVVELAEQTRDPIAAVNNSSLSAEERDGAREALLESRRTLLRAGVEYIDLEKRVRSGATAQKLADAARRMEALFIDMTAAGWSLTVPADVFWTEVRK